MNHKSIKAFLILCIAILLLVISATGAFVALSLKESRNRYLEYTQHSLWSQIDIAEQAISNWLNYKITVTARFSDSFYFRETIKPLLKESGSWQSLKSHPLQQEINEMFSLHISQKNGESFQLLTPNHRIIASSDPLLLGEYTQKLQNVPQELAQIEEGHTVAFPLRNQVWKHHKEVSLEIASPIFDEKMQLIAILLIEFDASQPLSSITHQANSAAIGTLCTTGMNGHFLNTEKHPVRYDRTLASDLWAQIEQHNAEFSGEILFQFDDNQHVSSYALVFKHPKLPILLVAKTTKDQALVHYFQQRNQILLLAILIISLCIISLILLYLLNKHQVKKQHKENQELEQRVNERTEALRAQSEELSQALQAAQAAVRTKSQFLANMSHEIRTPMNAIIGFTEILRQSDLNDTQSKQLDIVSRSANSLLTLLNDILDLSKMEAGKLELEKINFSMPELINDVVNTLSIKAAEKSLTFSKVISPECQGYFVGDPGRLKQVLINIVGNAIKFTNEGSVTIHAQPAENGLKICVEDTGIGISKSRHQAIFNAFTQADSSITRSYGGTGLGTTISHQIIAEMGGHIELLSEEGVGSTFIVHLQLPHGTKPEQAPIPPAIHECSHKLSILYAEDIAENIELIQVWLKPYEHKLIIAQNGQEAFDLFITHSFDIVLMDIQMPVMDGLTATRKIRQFELQQEREATPIIALSASALKEEITQSQTAGCNAFVTKPVDIHKLLTTIEDLLPEHQAYSGLDSMIWQHPMDFPTISGVDIQAGLKTWRSAETFQKSLLSFAQKYCQQEQTIQALVEAKNVAELKTYIHGLHGVAGNLKISQVFELTGKLTDLLNHSSLPFVQSDAQITQIATQLSEALTHICHDICAALQQSTEQQSAEQQNGCDKNCILNQQNSQSPSIINSVDQIRFLEQLLKMINSDDVDKMELVIRQYKAEFDAEPIRSIENAVNEFDFDTARVHTEQMLSQLKRQ